MNRIPRAATKLKVTTLTKSSASKVGEEFIAQKTDRGQIADIKGKTWSLFVDHLRNDNFCKIEVLEQRGKYYGYKQRKIICGAGR